MDFCEHLCGTHTSVGLRTEYSWSGNVYCPLSLTAPGTVRLLRPQGGGWGSVLELGLEAAFLLSEQPEGSGLGAGEGWC